MIRGTTPTHVFKLPVDAGMIQGFMISYAQNGVEILKKEMYDCEIADHFAGVTLTQEDTLALNPKNNVQIQARLLTKEGAAFASPVYVVNVMDCLNSEVM